MKLFGSLSAITFSPIVTIEPRRRKFHCPIKLKIPLPPGYKFDTSANLRLLCSITGGQSKAIWEDVTSSTPLTISDKCLLFTTTVSARFWLVHCQRSQRCQDAARFAQELWRNLVQVPFMAKFVVFAKRRDINEASVRVFSMTDDKEEKTLEVQEHYTLVARSRDVEVLDGQVLFLEFGGNLIPTHLSLLARNRSGSGSASSANNNNNSTANLLNSSTLINEQLAFQFYAFQENRLAFGVRLREVGKEPSGRIAFMEDSIKYLASLNQSQRAYLNERRRRAVCTLGVQLPAMCVHYDNILGTPKRNSYYATARIGDLTLADIAAELNIARIPPQSSARSTAQHQQQQRSSGAWSPEVDSLNQELDDHQEQRVGVSTSGSLLSAAASSSLAGGEGPGQLSGSRRRRPDWMELAPKLGIPRDEVEFIAEHCGGAGTGQALGDGARGPELDGTSGGVAPALLLLMHWYRLSSPDDRDQDLARGLLAIERDDIAQKLNFPIEPKRMSRSTMELLREIELIPVRSSENLYGSEISSYTTASRPSGVGGAGGGTALMASRGTSLRRLDQNQAGAAGAAGPDLFEDERRRQRAGSESASSAALAGGRQLEKQQRQRQRSTENDDVDAGADNNGRQFDNSQVPAIEVSKPEKNRSVKRNKMEGGDLAPSATAAATTTTSMITATSQPMGVDLSSSSVASIGQPAFVQQHRAMIENMARNLADDTLNEALEIYLRSQLQATADETIQAAFAAATGGSAKSERGLLSTSGQAGEWAAMQGLADDDDDCMSQCDVEDDHYEDDDNDGDDDDSDANDDDDTLNAHLQGTDSNSCPSGDQSLRQSISPNRLDGRDIFQDLSEMSNYADRIDSILEQSASEHSTRSGSQLGRRTESSWPPSMATTRPRSVSPFFGSNEHEQVDEDDDEVD